MKKIIADLTAAALKTNHAACITAAGAYQVMEDMNWLGHSLTDGQKISASRICYQQATEKKPWRPTRLQGVNRRQPGEDRDEHAARMLTGKWDV